MDPLSKARAALKRKRDEENELLLRKLEPEPPVNKIVLDTPVQEIDMEEDLSEFKNKRPEGIKMVPYEPQTPKASPPISEDVPMEEEQETEPLVLAGWNKKPDDPGFIHRIYQNHIHPAICELPSRCLWVGGIVALSLLQIAAREHLTGKLNENMPKAPQAMVTNQPNPPNYPPVTIVHHKEPEFAPRESRF